MKICVGIKWFSDKLTYVYNVIAALFMVMLVFSSFMQVLTRYVFNNSWTWTEEMARYAFIWMNFTGAAAGFRKGQLVAVDNIYKMTKGTLRIVFSFLVSAVVGVIGYVFFRYGIELINLVGGNPSVVMRIPMALIHASEPVFGLGLMINALAGFIETVEMVAKEKKEAVKA